MRAGVYLSRNRKLVANSICTALVRVLIKALASATQLSGAHYVWARAPLKFLLVSAPKITERERKFALIFALKK